ncbi:MAG: glycosyltransferase family 2 protein [Actinomycetota bacterium]
MSRPFFTVLVTTYDRAQIVRRCVDSCLGQTFSDYEVVVVDDGSTDDTFSILERIDDPRLRVVAHESNRGIDPSRHTGVANSRGEWIVHIDSDDELFPYTLERLREFIDALPDGVRVLRTRLLWDDGRITPAFVPTGPIDYEGRLRAWEADRSDAGNCWHRSVFDLNPYFRDRRGAMEALRELNMSRVETTMYVPDVLAKVHTDAPNSWARGADASEVIPRLLREAPDMLWMMETTIDEHGAALAQHAPRTYRLFLRGASTQAFLLGDRRKGFRYGLAALRLGRLDALAWGTLALGLLGPWAVVRGTVAHRRLNRLRP